MGLVRTCTVHVHIDVEKSCLYEQRWSVYGLRLENVEICTVHGRTVLVQLYLFDRGSTGVGRGRLTSTTAALVGKRVEVPLLNGSVN
jgi:hypothetical protein